MTKAFDQITVHCRTVQNLFLCVCRPIRDGKARQGRQAAFDAATT
jgi:hypothetical protein